MSDQDRNLVVTDIMISFGRLVVLFVKFGLAAIPATIIIAIIMSLVTMALGGVFGGFGLVLPRHDGRPANLKVSPPAENLERRKLAGRPGAARISGPVPCGARR